MKSTVQVAVIGGGVVGCSILYHLTKLGRKDVVLIERSELTAGSTWHAAGGMHTLNRDPSLAKLQKYTIALYQEIESISGESCGLHVTGGMMLAGSRERMDFLRQFDAKNRYLGVDTQLVSPAEAAALMPLLDPKYFVGALHNPLEGHVDPAGVTHAYAKAARQQGAEIYRHTRVVDLKPRPDGLWDVITDNGNIRAEHVVNAAGLWAREVGRIVGLELPVLAMEHMYLLTEDMPEVAEINARTGKEILHIIDFEGEIYMRQERGGMLIGTYEQDGRPWSPKTTPWDFGHELLPPDLDRIASSLETGFQHFPAFREAGIRQVINGPITFAPDGNPLIGPVRGLKNFWVACGIMAGFSQGGGVGLALANWICEGDPGLDIWAMDVSRFGDWATLAYTNAKVRENYSRRFQIRFPNEELLAARPLRTTPIYDRLKENGAVFGESWGLEHALWFAPEGMDPAETVSLRRSNAFSVIAEECRAVREAVGLIEISNFAKYRIDGPGAEEWLDRLLANRLPREGRISLSPMLNERGKIIGDFTVARAGAETFYLFGSGVAEEYHLRWFEAHQPATGVSIRSLRSELTGLSIAGPRAQELLLELVSDDVSTASLPFLSFRKLDIGMIPALVGRITFTGDTGYEFWVKSDHQRALYDLLLQAGKAFGIRHFGSRALNSLRLEKSFGTWAREFRPLYGPYEAGLGRFISLSKTDFMGYEAVLMERERGPKRRLVTLVVNGAGVDLLGDEPISHDGTVIGSVTSGGYAHSIGKLVALGYIPAELANALDPGAFTIEILGDHQAAAIAPRALFDPEGKRMRA